MNWKGLIFHNDQSAPQDDTDYTGGWTIDINDDGSVSSTDDGGEADDYGLRDGE
jgi:hypothetical protein